MRRDAVATCDVYINHGKGVTPGGVAPFGTMPSAGFVPLRARAASRNGPDKDVERKYGHARKGDGGAKTKSRGPE